MQISRFIWIAGFLFILTLFTSCLSRRTDPEFIHPPEFGKNESTCFVWSTEFYEIIPRLASAVSQQDPVTLFVGSQHVDRPAIESMLKKYGCRLENVRYVNMEGEFDNVWIRDYGPLYLKNRKREKKLVQFQYFWTDPGFIGEFASKRSIPVVKSTFNSSGGSREVNGKGLMILCEMHELDMNRGKTREDVEAEMKSKLGIQKVIWLKKGLPQDDIFTSGPIYDQIYPKGVNGHVDEFCRFADENTILLTSVSNEDAERHPILAEAKRRMDENYQILAAATDQDGKPFKILRVPMAPLLITDRRQGPEGQIIASVSSYTNFIISNSLIILPSYRHSGSKDPDLLAKEAEVERVFREAFPGRDLLKMGADTINYYSGGFHCLSIHEPK